MKLRFTPHSIGRQKGRGISNTLIRQAIQNPDKITKNSNGFKKLQKLLKDGRILVVVMTVAKESKIITIYFI